MPMRVIYLNQYTNEAGDLAINTQVSLFHNRLSNLIFRQSTGVYDSDTTGGSTTGLEFSSEWRWGLSSASVAFSYQESESSDRDNEVPMSPKWLGYFKFSHVLSEQLTASTNIRYVGKMYNDINCVSINDCVYLRPERPHSESAWLVDVQLLAKHWQDWPVKVGLSVKNLFDSHYTYPLTLNSEWCRPRLFRPGTSVAVDGQLRLLSIRRIP